MSGTAPAAMPVTGRVFDESRPGSVRSQLLTGAVGVALAFTLVVGQISLATTKGLQTNLEQVVANTRAGNETMESVIVKAEPSVLMDRLIARQAETLARTSETMTVLNGQMAVVGETTGSLVGTVDGMRSTSGDVASSVEQMQSDAERMAALLGGLPTITDRTYKRLDTIATDTRDINTELGAIGGKMQGYGLQQARGVKKR